MKYHNPASNVTFDCGTTKASSSLKDFIDFALNEGAVAGDVVFFDDVLVCEILLNEAVNDRTYDCLESFSN